MMQTLLILFIFCGVPFLLFIALLVSKGYFKIKNFIPNKHNVGLFIAMVGITFLIWPIDLIWYVLLGTLMTLMEAIPYITLFAPSSVNNFTKLGTVVYVGMYVSFQYIIASIFIVFVKKMKDKKTIER